MKRWLDLVTESVRETFFPDIFDDQIITHRSRASSSAAQAQAPKSKQ
jgi:hypothetical protein